MEKFYKIISTVFMPILLPTYGILLALLLPTFNNPYVTPLFKGIMVGGTILFTLILPSIPILILKKKGEISDLFISDRRERLVPYLFTFLGYVFWSYFLWDILEVPMYISAVAIGTSIAIFIDLLINVKWKISVHTTGIGCFAGAVFGVCYHLGINPVGLFILTIFLCVLVAVARINLKAHTPTQALAGLIVGFLSVFMSVLFFR